MIDSIPINNIAKYAGFTSVLELENEKTITLFPNPAREKITIQTKEIIRRIKIYSLVGNETTSCVLQSDNSIDVSSLSSGMYFLSAETDRGRIVKKFIKE